MLMAAVWPAMLQAQELAEVQGNTRTRTRHVEKLFEDCANEPEVRGLAGEALASRLRQCLLNSRLFSQVEVVEAHPGAYRVWVDERWTLIPLPYAQVESGDERTVGGILMESNLFGLGKLLILGGSVSDRGTAYTLAYIDRGIAMSNWRLTMRTGQTRQALEHHTGDMVTDELLEMRQDTALALGYRFRRLTAAVGLARQDLRFEAVEGFARPESSASLRVTGELRFEDSDYRLFYDDGANLRLDMAWERDRTDAASSVRLVRFRAQRGATIGRVHALVVELLAGSVEGGTVADAIRLGARPGFRGILSQSAWAERYAAVAADYRIPVAQREYGTWVVAGFADAGAIVHRGATMRQIDHAALGVGIYLFLRKIALPGIGVEVGYNGQYRGAFGAATLGFGF